MKFRLRVRLKPSNDRGEFELDWARIIINRAKKSILLAPETHNSDLIDCRSLMFSNYQ